MLATWEAKRCAQATAGGSRLHTVYLEQMEAMTANRSMVRVRDTRRDETKQYDLNRDIIMDPTERAWVVKLLVTLNLVCG